jgi:hypothetical protein
MKILLSAFRVPNVLVLLAWLTAGCGGGDDTSQQASSAIVLDPAKDHYGYSNSDWQVRWWQWNYEIPTQQDAQNCIIPIDDPTGEHCSYNQVTGKEAPVFFLAGTTNGTMVRNKCSVPLGKAIYFPIVTFSNDNAGRTPDMEQSDSALKDSVQALLDAVPVKKLSVELDGTPVPDLERFRTNVTEFSYQLPPEPNVYSCYGASGVTGEISPAYAAGFYVMLAPPAGGQHKLHFKGSSPLSMPPVDLDVTYNFKVE